LSITPEPNVRFDSNKKQIKAKPMPYLNIKKSQKGVQTLNSSKSHVQSPLKVAWQIAMKYFLFTEDSCWLKEVISI